MGTSSVIKGLAVALGLLGLTACGGPKLVTVTFPSSDGTSEYWACDRAGKACKGNTDRAVDTLAYVPTLSVVTPPQCKHGVAVIEIMLQGNEVTQVGYECAQPAGGPGGGPTPPGGTPPKPADPGPGGPTLPGGGAQ